jgi:glycosyltransferase involved in cell wall biosynthesis
MDAVTAEPPRRVRRQLFGRGSSHAPDASSADLTRDPPEVPLRIAMLAPPWIPIPSPGYGGVESVVSTLTEALIGRGHDVTLFCAPGSASRANVVSPLEQAHPDEIERSLYESDHVGRAFDRIDDAGEAGFDVVHDHCGFTGLAMANRIDTPLVHTLHRAFTADTAAFYSRHGHKAALVGISRAQLASAPPELQTIGLIPNPINVRAWPLQERKGDYLLWMGRIAPEKGPHRAIAAARAVDVPIVLAGVIRPGQQAFFDGEVAPRIDGTNVRFVGEVRGSAKRSLIARARGLLMPIRWEEPSGMVMIEALACGTPVIAFPEGVARELVTDGTTGFLVRDERAMADAIGGLPRIDPRVCREWVRRYCDVDVVAPAYERSYRSVAVQETNFKGEPPDQIEPVAIHRESSHPPAVPTQTKV